MLLSLLAILAAAPADDGRFWRTDQRTPQGRTHRGLLPQLGSVVSGVPFFSFAPTGGAGLGGNCSCTDVTDATGAIPMSMTRASVGFCGDETNQAFALCAVDKPRIIDGAYLREPAATNNLIRTDDLSYVLWGNNGVTLTPGQADPLGGTGATRVQTTACPTVGNLFVVYQSAGLFPTTNVSASVAAQSHEA